jgi:hypothetical protein
MKFLIILISALSLTGHSVLGQDTQNLRTADEYSKCKQGVRYSPPVLMDGFASMLEKEPGLRGYIVAYDGQTDRAGTAFKFAETYRAYVYESAIIGNRLDTITSVPSRVVSLNGGKRKERTIELWLVPANAPEPKLTPTAQTKTKRKD